MNELLKIDDETITLDSLVNYLKLNNEFDDILEQYTRHKIAVLAAKRRGIIVEDEEVQKLADDFRRILGVHRAKETMDWLNAQGLTVDNLHDYLTDQLYKKKACAEVTSDDKIEQYFQLNSPTFEAVTMKSIVVDSSAKATELKALLEDEIDQFDALAREYSVADDNRETTSAARIRRGNFDKQIESAIFNASVGEIVGPFELAGEYLYEIIQVCEFHPAELNEATRAEIGDTLYYDWLDARIDEHAISVN